MSSTTNDTPTTADTLRALADWLDAHPTANGTVDFSMGHGRILDYTMGRDEITAQARALGGQWEKDISEMYFWLRQEVVPGVTYDLYTMRDIVCERVVVGTEEVEIPDPDVEVPTVTVVRDVVEWRCPDSLLDRDPYPPAEVRPGVPPDLAASLEVLADAAAAPRVEK